MKKIELFKDLFKENLLEIREFNELFPVVILQNSNPKEIKIFIEQKKKYNQFYKFLPIFLSIEFIQMPKIHSLLIFYILRISHLIFLVKIYSKIFK